MDLRIFLKKSEKILILTLILTRPESESESEVLTRPESESESEWKLGVSEFPVFYILDKMASGQLFDRIFHQSQFFGRPSAGYIIYIHININYIIGIIRNTHYNLYVLRLRFECASLPVPSTFARQDILGLSGSENFSGSRSRPENFANS
jgi:hypothetical protein